MTQHSTTNETVLRSHSIQRYGWVPDLPDMRDHRFKRTVWRLPSLVDLRPECPPVYDQGDLGCHDELTEVLTDKGWTRWSSLTGAELLGTVSPTSGELELQAPIALQRYEYDGPLFGIDNRSLDFALTPNHRMWLRKWDERKRTLSDQFHFAEVQNIGWYAGLLPTTTGWSGVELERIAIGNRSYTGNDFLSLLALILSDGWVGGTDNNKNTVSFCCFRPDRNEMVRDLAQRLDLPELSYRPGVWKWSDGDLSHWIKTNCFTVPIYRSPFKKVPEIVKCASQVQITKFLEFFGDQSTRSFNRMYYSSSHRMIDDLQELMLRIGRRGSICERDPRTAVMKDGRRIEKENCTANITLVERYKDTRLSIERKKMLHEQPYRGEVFCATVPNGLLVTRRNGSILISGNSCTGNAIAGALQFDRRKQNLVSDFVPSRLFIYYNERVIEHTVAQDAGAMIRDGIKAVAKLGAPPETDWPYNVAKFAQKPPATAFTDALADRALAYARVARTTVAMRACLAGGYPFVFGFSVYESFESAAVAKTGVVPMPTKTEQLLGGHAVLAVGYDDSQKRFIARNSWAADWGQEGYFTIPYGYLTNANLADDFWTIRLVAQPAVA